MLSFRSNAQKRRRRPAARVAEASQPQASFAEPPNCLDFRPPLCLNLQFALMNGSDLSCICVQLTGDDSLEVQQN
jgi:hypothetical protein